MDIHTTFYKEVLITKKKFNVCVKTTFRKWYEVEAETQEEAEEEINSYIEEGDATDTDDFETEIETWQ